MRVAVMKIHAVCEVGYVTREFENDEFENWKWLVAIEVQDAVFDFERSLTAQEETAVEVFIEERLAVLTCGGLFLESSLFLENGARHAC